MRKPRGIRYVADSNLTWRRKKAGESFEFINRLGQPLKPADEARVKSLVIPPAWEHVRISPDSSGHILAIGTDAKGRKQYIYHPDWIAYNQRAKFDSLQYFGEALPTLRETIAGHMRQHTLTRERILGTVVWLLEHTFIRIGNEAYAKENQSYGLTTMRNKHVDVEGNTVKFSFKGKSNVFHELDINNHRVAVTIKECIELPGYQLFQYLDDDGKRHRIDSSDVNGYLQEITGENFSAKDFRTWGGTTLAGERLYEIAREPEVLSTEKALIQAVKDVSEHLGNTTTVCRKYYIHPTVVTSHEKNLLVPHYDQIMKSGEAPKGLRLEEHAILSLL